MESVAPVVEDYLVQLGRGEMVCNARAILGLDASILELHKPPLCAAGAVLPPDRIALIMPTNWNGDFHIDGQEMSPRSVYVVDSPNGFFSRGLNTQFYGVTIKREPLRATAAALLGVDPEDVKIQSELRNIPLPFKHLLAQKCESLLKRVPRSADGVLVTGFLDDDLTRRLQEVILEIYLTSRSSERRTNSSYTNGPRIIRRAEQCFEAAGKSPLSLADLCKATGVSSSTLYAAFSEMVGMPPLRYFRMRRLNAAHKELCRSERESGQVSRVATSLGFTELGRFSVEYRKLFGVSPSMTLSSRSVD